MQFLRDAPNAQPPHQYIAICTLFNTPVNLSMQPLPQPGVGQTTFDLIPTDQLGMTEDDVPGQPLREDGKNTT